MSSGGEGIEAVDEDEVELVQCIYTGAALRPFDEEELTALLSKARVHNESKGLTGMLLYAEGSYFQVLEGPAEDVDGLYRCIELDPRHTLMTKLIRETIKDRSFEDWTMGFCRASNQDVARIVGMNDFLRVSHARPEEQAGRARKLLAAFREGRWRKRISA
jgi:hypothetical protein